jgi:hypothetical protein
MLLTRFASIDPHVVLWGEAGPSLARRAWTVLRHHADLPIIGIASGGRAAAVCALRPNLEPVPDLTGAALTDLVRRLAAASSTS